MLSPTILKPGHDEVVVVTEGGGVDGESENKESLICEEKEGVSVIGSVGV